MRIIQHMDTKTAVFIERASALHKNKYDYSLVTYKMQYDLVDIICPDHGVFQQIPKNHLLGYGCRKCSGCIADKESFLKKAIQKHGNKFDYSITVYEGANKPIVFNCPSHGVQTVIASNHLRGHGCPECGKKAISQKNLMTLDEFIKKAQELHSTKYDYSQTLYKSARENVTILCRIHGQFKQKAYSHLSGNGCPYCAGVIRSTENFIKKAIEVHGSRYTYEKSEYKNSKNKITITCPDHGDFKCTSSDFLRGSGCRGCMSSHTETMWLNLLNVPVRQHKIVTGDKYIIVDGYCPETNTVYEFHGDFWHGNPDLYAARKINKKNGLTFGELYQKTLLREEQIKELGYNLISVWENDWNKTQ